MPNLYPNKILDIRSTDIYSTLTCVSATAGVCVGTGGGAGRNTTNITVYFIGVLMSGWADKQILKEGRGQLPYSQGDISLIQTCPAHQL